MTVQLVAVTRDNLRALCKLDAGDGGHQVAPNVMSMAQAAVYPEAWPRAIVAGGEAVGFLMLYDPTLTPAPEQTDFTLWRLMIDRAHQHKGHGRQAVGLAIAHARERGAARLLVSYVPPGEYLAGFYASFGFVPTGDLDEGEIVLALSY